MESPNQYHARMIENDLLKKGYKLG
jgi:hypothetical protein